MSSPNNAVQLSNGNNDQDFPSTTEEQQQSLDIVHGNEETARTSSSDLGHANNGHSALTSHYQVPSIIDLGIIASSFTGQDHHLPRHVPLDLVHTVTFNAPAIVDLVHHHGRDVTNGAAANARNGNNGHADSTDAKPTNDDLAADTETIRPPTDEGDAWGFGKSSPSTNFARMPVEKDSEIYNMNHRRRGVAFIFNHMYFDPRLGLKERNGTNADRDNLRLTLRSLDFEVKVFNDLAFKEIDRLLEECAREDHSDADCILVSVLSHGELNILYGSDHAYKPERLWSHFTADKSPTLAGKPKLFFIQACQGDQLDAGVHLKRMTETDSNAMSYKIPNHADFLIAYSTIPGYYSWRNTSAGSWFIQAFCQVLQKEAATRDLLSIMTRVARRVAFDFQSNTPGDYMMHEKKQIPCISSMLTRDIFFTRKRSILK